MVNPQRPWFHPGQMTLNPGTDSHPISGGVLGAEILIWSVQPVQMLWHSPSADLNLLWDLVFDYHLGNHLSQTITRSGGQRFPPAPPKGRPNSRFFSRHIMLHWISKQSGNMDIPVRTPKMGTEVRFCRFGAMQSLDFFYCVRWNVDAELCYGYNKVFFSLQNLSTR